MPEPIEFDIYPCWEQQSGEDNEAYSAFVNWYLPLPKANMRLAYNNYWNVQIGTNSRKTEKVSGRWQDWGKEYRWGERHQSYWLEKAQSNLDWISAERQRLASMELTVAQAMMQRAIEILALPIDPERTSPKDAATLARAASELGRLALGLDNIDKAIDTLTKSGFSVGLGSEIKGMLADEKISALLESRGNRTT